MNLVTEGRSRYRPIVQHERGKPAAVHRAFRARTAGHVTLTELPPLSSIGFRRAGRLEILLAVGTGLPMPTPIGTAYCW